MINQPSIGQTPEQVYWSGSWTSGEITIEGISQHSLFAVTVQTYNGSTTGTTRFFAVKYYDNRIEGTWIDYWGSGSDDGSALAVNSFICNVSGDTLSNPRFVRRNVSTGYVYAFRGITSITSIV